ncbi:hypothetical protein [Salinicoccus halodurans]|uniref:Uncharacterized protein n=1 Tax=Salinicoccus halodurans TaxID=407035 RepID=A0AA94HH21_9STAP|nr:hypothetical protein [Salinicoccus halodurans]SFK88452.1 hypothetical protein SAMN05216235_2231 [Salinicoccus halodurans]
MTRFLLNLVLMGIITLGIYWVIITFIPPLAGYSIPIALLLGITIGFFIYIQIDNRMGP